MCNKPFKPLGYPSGRVWSREGFQKAYLQSRTKNFQTKMFNQVIKLKIKIILIQNSIYVSQINDMDETINCSTLQ